MSEVGVQCSPPGDFGYDSENLYFQQYAIINSSAPPNINFTDASRSATHVPTFLFNPPGGFPVPYDASESLRQPVSPRGPKSSARTPSSSSASLQGISHTGPYPSSNHSKGYSGSGGGPRSIAPGPNPPSDTTSMVSEGHIPASNHRHDGRGSLQSEFNHDKGAIGKPNIKNGDDIHASITEPSQDSRPWVEHSQAKAPSKAFAASNPDQCVSSEDHRISNPSSRSGMGKQPIGSRLKARNPAPGPQSHTRGAYQSVGEPDVRAGVVETSHQPKGTHPFATDTHTDTIQDRRGFLHTGPKGHHQESDLSGGASEAYRGQESAARRDRMEPSGHTNRLAVSHPQSGSASSNWRHSPRDGNRSPNTSAVKEERNGSWSSSRNSANSANSALAPGITSMMDANVRPNPTPESDRTASTKAKAMQTGNTNETANTEVDGLPMSKTPQATRTQELKASTSTIQPNHGPQSSFSNPLDGPLPPQGIGAQQPLYVVPQHQSSHQQHPHVHQPDYEQASAHTIQPHMQPTAQLGTPWHSLEYGPGSGPVPYNPQITHARNPHFQNQHQHQLLNQSQLQQHQHQQYIQMQVQMQKQMQMQMQIHYQAQMQYQMQLQSAKPQIPGPKSPTQHPSSGTHQSSGNHPPSLKASLTEGGSSTGLYPQELQPHPQALNHPHISTLTTSNQVPSPGAHHAATKAMGNAFGPAYFGPGQSILPEPTVAQGPAPDQGLYAGAVPPTHNPRADQPHFGPGLGWMQPSFLVPRNTQRSNKPRQTPHAKGKDYE
eukprot:TRINITY_DN476_c0_g7_i1.p1 TRINITY_DN476_c0_g7~~TRINITY_DN476_c0_g7_i1.p1  ORF type:complete len:877 (-),score=147.52 TRINITY_DN476_c0_g7_i1:103-2424(-)